MRRLNISLRLTLALALLISLPSHAQMTLTGAGGTKGASGRSCTDDTASTNFLARTSGLSNTEKDAACNLIKGLESDSIITGNLSGANGCGTVLDALYVVATSSTTNAALNWCGTNFSLVTHGTLTFTADIGYTGDGSTGYLDTQYVPTGGVNLTLNSAAIGAYIQTSGAGVSNTVIMGANNGGSTFLYLDPVNGSNFNWEVNGGSFPAAANANVQGAWVASRNGSSSTTNLYRNGATTFGTSASDTSVTLSNGDMCLFALCTGTSASAFANYQASAFFMSGGLTSTQAFAINNRINTYMTALGHNIY